MDFTLDDEQTALVELAGRILDDRCTPEALRAAEDGGNRFDPELWRLLAEADLLGLCLPGSDGGGGYGVLEATLLCREIGRTAAPVPLWSTLMLGALPLVAHGSDALRARLIPGVAEGSLVLTAALAEAGSSLPPRVPTTVARPSGGGWALSGHKAGVASVHLAGTGPDVRVLVPARTGDASSTVFAVNPTAAGVSLEHQIGADLEPVTTMVLDGVAVGADDIVGDLDAGATVVATITAVGTAGICARQAGTCHAALHLAAGYTSQRKQFGSPIATFQAVAQRLADAYIDTEAIGLTSLYAAWLLSRDLPAGEALGVAKVWATEGAQRVVHAAQHVHGGIGVDTDYPQHRFFRAAKAAEHTLGTVHPHLVDLGRSIVGAA